MKKILLSFILLILTVAVFAQVDQYTLRSRYYTKVDSILILNNDTIHFVEPITDGQILQRIDGIWKNSTAAVGIDSITNTGDGWLRVYYGGNVVDSALLTQFVVFHDETLIGLGTVDSVLRVDTANLALKTWVTEQIIVSNGYDDESAQDAVGGILKNSGDVVFTYDDAGDSISATVKDDSHNHIISNVDNLQDSLDSKQTVITGAATTVTDVDLTANRALISSATGKIAASTIISTTELGYIDNARSNIQTQIDNIIYEIGIDTIFAEEDVIFPIEHLKYIKQNDTTYVTSIAVPDGLIFGGYVNWESGLLFNISPAAYYIDGDYYSVPASQVTLDASDNDSSRIDVIVVDTFEVVSVIKGVNAISPQKPTINPQSQIELTSVLILANATEPTNPGTGDTIKYEVIYDENIEWTGSLSGVTGDFNGTTLPYSGSKVADIGTLTTVDEIRFTNDSYTAWADYKTLSFAIKLKQAFTNKSDIYVFFWLGNDPVNTIGYKVIMDKSSLNWQVITIPILDLTWTNSHFDRVVFRYASNTSNNGIYLDNVRLQGNLTQPIQAEAQTLLTDGTPGNISISGGNTITLNVNDNQTLSIDSLNRVFTIRLTNGDSIKFEDTNTTYDLSGIRDTLQFHRDSLILVFDSIAAHNERLIELEISSESQNLTYAAYQDKGIMNISGGTGDSIPLANYDTAGLLSPEDKWMLDSALIYIETETSLQRLAGGDTLYFDETIKGTGLIDDPLGVDSLLIPTLLQMRSEISDSIATIEISGGGYQKIDTLSLSGTTLNVSLENDGEPAKTVDLSSINATHTGEVTGATTLTIADNVVDYGNVDETLKDTIVDNDLSWNYSANSIIYSSVSGGTIAISNGQINKTILVVLTVSSFSSISVPAYIKVLNGSADFTNGVFYLYIHCIGTNLYTMSIIQEKA